MTNAIIDIFKASLAEILMTSRDKGLKPSEYNDIIAYLEASITVLSKHKEANDHV